MTSDAGWDAALAELKAQYRSDLARQVLAIDALWKQAASADRPLEPLAELRRHLHSLAGAAGTFGFAEIGEIAAAAEKIVEACCERGASPGDRERSEVDALIARLRISSP